MDAIVISGRLSFEAITPPPPQTGDYLIGLHDYQANDPLGDPYTDKPYYPRNWPSRPSVPEVRRFQNPDDKLYLTEGIEWLWAFLYKLRNPAWSLDTLKLYFRRMTTTDRAFTNKVAWNTPKEPRRSWVLNENPKARPVQLLGIVTPGGNRFRSSGRDKTIVKDNQRLPCTGVWNLDYDWLTANITKDNAEEFARTLPDWLVFTARIVHPEKIGAPVSGAPNGVFRITNFDGDFCVPMITTAGRQSVVDGFYVRENWLQSNRLNRLYSHSTKRKEVKAC